MAALDPNAAIASAENAPELVQAPGVFPPFDAHTFVSQLWWLVIVFGALYWLMSRVALPRVGGILEARRARIEGDLAAATAMQQQASAASAAYDATLASAKAGAQALAQKTHDKLHHETESRRHALDADLNAKLAAAESQIGAMKSRAMANVADIARDAATAIVQHLTGRTPDAAAIEAAVATSKPNRGLKSMFDAEFFVTLGFIIFVLGLGYLGVHRQLTKALDDRGVRIAGELAQAKKLHDEAAALLDSYKRKAAAAEAEAKAIVDQAQREAEAMAQEAATRMEEFVARRTKQAEAKIAMAETLATAEVKAAAADAAVKAAEIVLTQDLRGPESGALIDREIGKLASQLN